MIRRTLRSDQFLNRSWSSQRFLACCCDIRDITHPFYASPLYTGTAVKIAKPSSDRTGRNRSDMAHIKEQK
jgi:hypothetical protein